ncbi:hypothetical protein [Bifidobacterium cuniculi]|uniref:hypothetical protein n=1 Tax=Bifidobacterium cuniculi TaxID=1688 RepID=UPI001269E887|nr:hypothetical protein [Bifidobacterium cuniculi]
MPVRAGSKQQVPADSPAQIEAQLRAHYPVSHSTASGNVAVATWRDGDIIRYEHNLVDDDAVCTGSFEYPTARPSAGGDHAAADTAGG